MFCFVFVFSENDDSELEKQIRQMRIKSLNANNSDALLRATITARQGSPNADKQAPADSTDATSTCNDQHLNSTSAPARVDGCEAASRGEASISGIFCASDSQNNNVGAA